MKKKQFNYIRDAHSKVVILLGLILAGVSFIVYMTLFQFFTDEPKLDASFPAHEIVPLPPNSFFDDDPAYGKYNHAKPVFYNEHDLIVSDWKIGTDWQVEQGLDITDRKLKDASIADGIIVDFSNGVSGFIGSNNYAVMDTKGTPGPSVYEMFDLLLNALNLELRYYQGQTPEFKIINKTISKGGQKEMANPKERFLNLFYTALKSFEDETGAEIHGIKMERVSANDIKSPVDKTVIIKYDLELK